MAHGVGRQGLAIATPPAGGVRVTALGHGGNAMAAGSGGEPYVVHTGVAPLAAAGLTFHPVEASLPHTEARVAGATAPETVDVADAAETD